MMNCPLHNKPSNGLGYWKPRDGVPDRIPACSPECLNEIARLKGRVLKETKG